MSTSDASSASTSGTSSPARAFRRLPLLALAGALLLSAPACDTTGIEDAIDNFALVIELKPINTNVTVQLLDAATGELIDNNLDVTFSGPDGGQVVNFYSDPMGDRVVKNGILNFGIANARVPSPGSPVQVTVEAGASAFLTTSRTFEVTSTGNHVFQLPVVRRSAPPSGVVLGSQPAGSATAETGTQQAIEVKADNPANPDDAPAGFSAPVGTVFLDANNQPLTGNLRVETVYFDVEDPQSMQAFPADLPATIDGDAVVLAGGLSVQIVDASGRVATATQEAGKRKPLNGPSFNHTAEKAGSAIPTVWFYEFPTPPPPSVMDDFFLVTVGYVDMVPEFIFDSFSWFENTVTREFNQSIPTYIAGGFKSPTCPQTIEVVRNGNEGVLFIKVFGTGFTQIDTIPAGSSTFTFDLPLTNMSGSGYTVLVNTASAAKSSKASFNCTTFQFPLDAPPSNLIDSTVEVVLQCDQADEKVRVTDIPSASVLYRKQSAPSGTEWRSATDLRWNYNAEEQALMGGSLRVADVEQGETYTFKLSYDDYVKQADVAISSTNVVYTQVIEEDICR